MRKINIDRNSRSTHRSLVGRENLYDELISWLRSKELSVCQAQDLLTDTAGLINDAWHTEAKRTKV